jgi:hypothetical protein
MVYNKMLEPVQLGWLPFLRGTYDTRYMIFFLLAGHDYQRDIRFIACEISFHFISHCEVWRVPSAWCALPGSFLQTSIVNKAD